MIPQPPCRRGHLFFGLPSIYSWSFWKQHPHFPGDVSPPLFAFWVIMEEAWLCHQALESDTKPSLTGILIIRQGNDRKNSADFVRSFLQPKIPSAFLSKLNFKRKIH